jgi:hypothetical protein
MNKVYISFLGEAALPYVTHDLLTVGDYSGAGSIGAANIAYLLEEFGTCTGGWAVSDGDNYTGTNGVYPSLEVDATQEAFVIRKGDYGYEQAYVLESAWLERGYELENYPVLDDDTHLGIEEEWAEAAWDDYGRRELERELEELGHPEFEEQVRLYKDTGHRLSDVAVFKYSNAHLDAGKVLEDFLEWEAEVKAAREMAAFLELLRDQGAL